MTVRGQRFEQIGDEPNGEFILHHTCPAQTTSIVKVYSGPQSASGANKMQGLPRSSLVKRSTRVEHLCHGHLRTANAEPVALANDQENLILDSSLHIFL
jgi:hypothetical protein